MLTSTSSSDWLENPPIRLHPAQAGRECLCSSPSFFKFTQSLFSLSWISLRLLRFFSSFGAFARLGTCCTQSEAFPPGGPLAVAIRKHRKALCISTECIKNIDRWKNIDYMTMQTLINVHTIWTKISKCDWLHREKSKYSNNISKFRHFTPHITHLCMQEIYFFKPSKVSALL